MKKKEKKGFSITEMMVAIAIAGIAATIAIPNFQRYNYKSKQNEMKSHIGSVYSLMKNFYGNYQSYTSRFDAIGFNPEGNLSYRIGFDSDRLDPALPNTLGSNMCFDTGAHMCPFWMDASVGGAAPGGMIPADFMSFFVGAVTNFGMGPDSWSIDNVKNLQNPVPGL